MKRLAFDVDGATVVGDLHLPDGAGPFPAAIVGGPMTSVKEQVTGVYAAALATRGVAAFAIDHRFYGESGGAPRQYEHYPSKIADLRAAIDTLAAEPEIDADRLAAVGVCLGAGYVAHAIAERRDIRGFVGVAGYYRDVAAMRSADPDGFDAKVAQGRAARLKYASTGEVDLVPAAALQGDAAMSLQSTHDYYCDRAAHPNYTNAFAVMSREYFLPFDVQSAAPKLPAPFLMIHGPNALNPTWADRFFDAAPVEKRRVPIDSQGQTDIYDDPEIVAFASSAAVDFLRDHGL